MSDGENRLAIARVSACGRAGGTRVAVGLLLGISLFAPTAPAFGANDSFPPASRGAAASVGAADELEQPASTEPSDANAAVGGTNDPQSAVAQIRLAPSLAGGITRNSSAPSTGEGLAPSGDERAPALGAEARQVIAANAPAVSPAHVRSERPVVVPAAASARPGASSGPATQYQPNGTRYQRRNFAQISRSAAPEPAVQSRPRPGRERVAKVREILASTASKDCLPSLSEPTCVATAAPAVLHPVGIAIMRAILERDGGAPAITLNEANALTRQTEWILAPVDRNGKAQADRRSAGRPAPVSASRVAAAPIAERELATNRITGHSTAGRPAAVVQSRPRGAVAGSAFSSRSSGGGDSHDVRWLLFLAFAQDALSGIGFALATAVERRDVHLGTVIARLRSRTLGGSRTARRARTAAAAARGATSAIRYRE
jgi:hypothetical protein